MSVHLFPPRFILDVDDMMVDTEGAMCKIIQDDFGYICPVDTYLTMDNTNGHHAQVLREAKFMATAPLLPHVVDLFDEMEELVGKGALFDIATHRGYHADGKHHTVNMLANNGVLHLFQDIHVLDFNTVPDKVQYLDSIYGVGQYHLFDDRPRFDQGHPLPDHVWLFDRPWNQHIQGNRTDHVLTTIRSLMKGMAA